MKCSKMFLGILGLMVAFATSAQAIEVHTWDPNGADAELRESQVTNPRGTGSEIASRTADSRASVIYLKFGVSGFTAADLKKGIGVQTHVRNNDNFRITNTVDPNQPNTGFNYYVLDPTVANADWVESTITPFSASATQDNIGFDLDGNFSTWGTGTPGAPTSNLTFLGNKETRDPWPNGNALLIDEAYNFILPVGSPLHDAIAAAQGTAHKTVTIAMNLDFNWVTDNPNIPGEWNNRNFLFQPKEHAGNGSPLAPSLFTTVPEPTSLALLSLGSLALLRRRK